MKDTRQRVLESACGVFAEKGFRDATMAEICEGASANIAAANYYFGDKERLYDAAWRHARDIAMAAYPSDGGLDEQAGPDERLHAFISAMIRRIHSQCQCGWFPCIMSREMSEPTHALPNIIKEAIEPQRELLGGIVKELLGKQASRQQLHHCAFSVISQCLFPNFIRRMHEQGHPLKHMPKPNAKALIEHIYQFSMAGIRDMVERQKESDA